MRLTTHLPLTPRPLPSVEAHRLGLPDRVAAWWLRGPLSFALVTLAAIQVLSWLPQYLTWPWWADHDVFATMALGWSQGLLPYRDLLGNNFPGSIYLFWVVGTLFGWGRTAPFYAVDALLLLLLLESILIWSRRRFGTRLPGAIGVLAVLGYVLSLDYTQAAQRDSQAPMFTILAILAAETGGGVLGPILGGLLAASGWSIRPQTVLLWPALALALAQAAAGRSSPEGARRAVILAWVRAGLSLTIGITLVLAPLAGAGVLDDFFRGLRESALGESYNRVSAASFVVEMLRQISLRDVAAAAASLLLFFQAPKAVRGSALVWLTALVGVMFYRPLSPFPHAYLNHPRMLVSALNLAVLGAMVKEAGSLTPSIRLGFLLAVLAMGAQLRPTFASPVDSIREAPRVLAGKDTWMKPLGYRRNQSVRLAAVYEWRDYRYTLAYLRDHAGPETRIANVLEGVPALCGPLGRLPVFPAESIAWLSVRPDARARFLESLEDEADSVLVWAPSEVRRGGPVHTDSALDGFEPVIRRLYEPEAVFGAIEIWRRRR